MSANSFYKNRLKRSHWIAPLAMSSNVDVFVLVDGAHRYRDALALAQLLHNLPRTNVRIWPVRPLKGVRGNITDGDARYLTHPGANAVNRPVVVLGRLELYGTAVRERVWPTIDPPPPLDLTSPSSSAPEFRELRLETPLESRIHVPLRAPVLAIPRRLRGRPAEYDYGVVYAGRQQCATGSRPFILLEGLSALGTMGAVKAFCELPVDPMLKSIERFFAVFAVYLRLQVRNRTRDALHLLRADRVRAIDELPWRWEEIVVAPRPKRLLAAAPIYIVRGTPRFLGRPLRQGSPTLRGAVGRAILEHMARQRDNWVHERDIEPLARKRGVRGGWRLLLRQLLESLAAQHVYILRDPQRRRFRCLQH